MALRDTPKNRRDQALRQAKLNKGARVRRQAETIPIKPIRSVRLRRQIKKTIIKPKKNVRVQKRVEKIPFNHNKNKISQIGKAEFEQGLVEWEKKINDEMIPDFSQKNYEHALTEINKWDTLEDLEEKILLSFDFLCENKITRNDFFDLMIKWCCEIRGVDDDQV
jgi:hypothetical protein